MEACKRVLFLMWSIDFSSFRKQPVYTKIKLFLTCQ